MDCSRVLGGEENVRHLAHLDDVVEIESEHGGKAGGNSGRLRVGIRDRDADLFAGWLVDFRILTREYNEIRRALRRLRRIWSRAIGHLFRLWRRPRSDQLPHRYDLPDMVGGMINRDEHSPQIGLTGSVRDLGGKIDLTIGSESLERHAILPPPGDSFIPRLLTRWRSIGWPVIFRPLQLFLVVGVLKELEQIVLGDANVLEQLPR